MDHPIPTPLSPATPEDAGPIVLALPKQDGGEATNVSLRAVTPRGFKVREGINIIRGRMFTPGLEEVIVGDAISRRIAGLEVGQAVKYQNKRLNIVGVFSSQGAAFEISCA